MSFRQRLDARQTTREGEPLKPATWVLPPKPSSITKVAITTSEEENPASESSSEESRAAALKKERKKKSREARQKDKLRVIALEKDLETARKTHKEYELRVATLETDVKMAMETHLKDEKKHEDDQLELNQSKKRVRELEDELGLLKGSSDEEKKQCNECGTEKFISSFKVTTRKKGKDGNFKTYTSTRNVCNTCETRKRRKTSK